MWAVVRRVSTQSDFKAVCRGLSYQDALSTARDLFNQEVAENGQKVKSESRTSTSWLMTLYDKRWICYTVKETKR